jgi:hypothetical protein
MKKIKSSIELAIKTRKLLKTENLKKNYLIRFSVNEKRIPISEFYIFEMAKRPAEKFYVLDFKASRGYVA